ncbi:MAG: hypothetical protein P4L46_07130 [Fimbriimonas sp.]|nr:hypothetical protein [Fimbriimonas sp.]
MKPTMKIAMGLLFGLMLFGATSSIAAAQEDVSQKNISSLELEQADVREALRALFKNVNVSYSIAPEVQGPVTVSLKNVTFETALQNVLRQVDATYRIEGGVYEIVKREETLAPNTSSTETPVKTDTKIIRRIKIRSADPAFIAMMIGQKEGNQNYNVAPERSTIQNTQSTGGMGGMGGMGGGGMGGMGGGMGGFGGGMGGGGFGGGGYGGGGYGGGGFGGGSFGGGFGGGGFGGGGYGGGGRGFG